MWRDDDRFGHEKVGARRRSGHAGLDVRQASLPMAPASSTPGEAKGIDQTGVIIGGE
jgi:hypothetical protein